MSIVIAVIDDTLKNLYMYGDKRRSVMRDNGQVDRYDDVTKIFKLKEDLFFGITGVYLQGITIYQKLKGISEKQPLSSILQIASSLDNPDQTLHGIVHQTTLIIAGKDDFGHLFIWSKEGIDPPKLFRGEIKRVQFTAATSTNEYSYKVAYDTFKNCVQLSNYPNYERYIETTIQKVSEIDESVSSSFDSFKLSI